MLGLLVQAIGDAGYKTGAEGVSIALDPAAPEFRLPDGRYKVAGDLLTSAEMIDRYAAITQRFPVHLIEDGLGEDDDGWIALTERLGKTTELVGDDIFRTNPAIITRVIARGIGNAALIKLNQIGTVTETLEAMAICRQAGYRQFVSHRSGRPRTPSSPTWPPAPAAATSSPAPRPAVNGSPSTTGCWKSQPPRPACATACLTAEKNHRPFRCQGCRTDSGASNPERASSSLVST